jgi:trimeric autotransporter adhesin
MLTAVVAIIAGTVTALPSTIQAAPIPDDGLPPIPVVASALVSERTEVLAAGVVGINTENDSFPTQDIRVTSFAEIGNTMYVGGKFTQVQVASTGALNNQPFLAAFDRRTGAWISSFRPTVNGNVWDLKATPDGRLLVAGQFSNVNGAANTSGLAMLNASTGAVDPTWRVNLVLTGSTARPIARTLDIEGDLVYVGGNFTRVTGTDGVTKSVGRIARIRLSTGRADGAFAPNIDGVVFDLDATADRVYVVGNFLYVNNVFAIGQVPLQPANGQIVPGLQPWERTSVETTRNSYQQAILAVGDEVWQAGSEHNRQAYRKSDYGLIRSWVSNPYGDGQALAHLNGIVYAGSHSNGLLYRDAVRWPDLTGATTFKPSRWMEAFDTASHEQLTWYPQITSEFGEGSWSLFADSTNCLWTGGDFSAGSFDGSSPRYVGGFAKFCAADSVPPAAPTNPSAQVASNGVNLAWTGSTDDRGGTVLYEVLKNDAVLASFISITTFRDAAGTSSDRYFVRATDSAGNRSATTRVFKAPVTADTTAPSTPKNLVGTVAANNSVTLTWTPSTDNVGVQDYLVLRNSVVIATVTSPTLVIPSPAAGANYYQVRARDAAGNQSAKTPSTLVTITGADTTKPSTPRDLAGAVQPNGDVALTWTASTDNVGVVQYIVFRNNVEIARVPTAAATIVAPAAGSHFYQVLALDAAGNQSAKTPSLRIDI